MTISVGIIKKAINEAENSTMVGFQTGAVIFKGSNIISSGKNKIRGNGFIFPKYKKYKNNIHAEQDAILKINWSKIKNCSILIMRLTKTGKLSMARPCDMCMELIKHAGIKKVFYTTYESEIILEKIQNN